MKKICVIMGGVLPVPAIYGGGIETLIESIIKKYSREDMFSILSRSRESIKKISRNKIFLDSYTKYKIYVFTCVFLRNKNINRKKYSSVTKAL